jgi:hypothetical protein
MNKNLNQVNVLNNDRHYFTICQDFLMKKIAAKIDQISSYQCNAIKLRIPPFDKGG